MEGKCSCWAVLFVQSLLKQQSTGLTELLLGSEESISTDKTVELGDETLRICLVCSLSAMWLSTVDTAWRLPFVWFSSVVFCRCVWAGKLIWMLDRHEITGSYATVERCGCWEVNAGNICNRFRPLSLLILLKWSSVLMNQRVGARSAKISNLPDQPTWKRCAQHKYGCMYLSVSIFGCIN